MFVFGTQYLRGATPDKSQWEKDMQSMKALGFNTIRAWLLWNTLEPKEGQYNFAYLHSFLDCAEKYGLQVGLLFHMHASPEWANRKYAHYFYVNENGIAFEPAVRPNTPGGGWPGLCFDHEEVRAIEERFITAVVKEARRHSNVAFYEPMNEPHQWIDYRSGSEVFCYCAATAEKFRQWLKKKYGTIEELNRAWGYFYGDFEEVRPPRWAPGYADYGDFRLFTMDNVAEEVRFRVQVIKKHDTRPVIAHAWGGGAVTCPKLGAMAFDDWKNAQPVDKWGYSAFPFTAENCVTLGLGSDSTRCAAGGKEYWQSELGAGCIGNMFLSPGRIDDDTFDKFSLESIRHGAKGLLYWQFRKERFSTELGGFAMTGYNGEATNLTRRVGLLGKMLQENGDLFIEGKCADPEVALVFSPRSYLADWVSNDLKHNKFAVDSISGYYRLFWEENIPTDILHEEFAGDLSRYKLIVIPSAIAISPRLAEKLKEYVQNGGAILSDHNFATLDENMQLSYQVPGFGFDAVFGASEDDLRIRETVELFRDGEKYTVFNNRFAETFQNVSAQVLYTYADGSPAILSNRYGKGLAVLSGINLGYSNSNRDLVADDIHSGDVGSTSSFSNLFVMDLCARLGIRGNICTAPKVCVSLIKTETECLAVILNMGNAEAVGEIDLGQCYSACKSVFNTLAADLQGNMLHFSVLGNKSAVVRLSV